MSLLPCTEYPHSIGLPYSMVAYHLGLGHFGEGADLAPDVGPLAEALGYPPLADA